MWKVAMMMGVYNNPKWSIALLRVLLSMVERSASVSVCGKRVELNRLSDHVHTGEYLPLARV